MPTVFLFTNDSVEARLIANGVHREIGLRAIITEGDSPLPRLQRLKGLAKWWLRLIGCGVAIRLVRRFRGEPQATLPKHLASQEQRLLKSAKSRLLREAGPAGRHWPQSVMHLYVRSVNDPDFVGWCKKQNPDLILVYGTRMLRTPIIRTPRLGVLNVHYALLPDYRGIHVEFWQVLNGDLDKSGVTIHFVDEGVDTGDIVLQEAANPKLGVDPYLLKTMNTIIAARLLPRAASQVLSGSAVRLAQTIPSTPTWRAKDITLERRIELLEKLQQNRSGLGPPRRRASLGERCQ
jgi:folate-dependent phosphoribosylglycinamide formyltransferase PurN